MQTAAEELLQLAPDGLQLTPGNAPTEGFEAWLSSERVPTRTHHGFHWHSLRQTVWTPDGVCVVASDSVHPPRARDGNMEAWFTAQERGSFAELTLETMYPGYALGTGEELEQAMSIGARLAVDVSHVHIQRCAGMISQETWRRLQDYPHIAEVHVSQSSGGRDAHLPLTEDSFGLAWVRERLAAGTPVVLECYMHRLEGEARRAQVALLRGEP